MNGAGLTSELSPQEAATLLATRKGQNTRCDLLEAVHKIQCYGMQVMAGFILGFDGDRNDIFDRQIDFIRASGIPLAMVGLLGALPNTQLWRRLERLLAGFGPRAEAAS